MRRWVIPLVVTVAVLGVGTSTFAGISDGYKVSAIVPNATNLVEGGSVMREGHEAGSIESISVEGRQARVTLDLDEDFGAVHEGAKVNVVWKAALGERRVTLVNGPKDHTVIPSGGMIKNQMPAPVEVDDVLSALDPATRDKVNGLVHQLEGTLRGREENVNATMRTAGPALQAVGSVLRGVGTDGEAIRQLVTQLNNTMEILGRRDQDLEQIVNGLGETTAATVGQREQLGQVLQRLPGTLERANTTLGSVPETVDRADPLLKELAPASKRLPSVARNLQPVLADVRPAVAELRPTLDAASELLQYTPQLSDSGQATAPGVNQALKGLGAPLNFLRPYTPELAGWMSNWASATGNYDANGHFARFHVQTGAEAANVNPGVGSPSVRKHPEPKPGELSGQDGADAFGDGMR